MDEGSFLFVFALLALTNLAKKDKKPKDQGIPTPAIRFIKKRPACDRPLGLRELTGTSFLHC